MLFNKTKNKKIIENVKFAKTYAQKTKGLIFEKPDHFNYALIFEFSKETRHKASLHMMFMRFPIGVLFLNKEKKVVDIAELKPWQLNYTPKQKAKYAIEMPIHKIWDISLEDVIEWNK
jgi:uncharacterized protein